MLFFLVLTCWFDCVAEFATNSKMVDLIVLFDAYSLDTKFLLTSQYGDIDKDIVAFGETKTIPAFLEDYFAFHYDQLVLSTVIVLLYPIVLASLCTYFIGRLSD